MITCTDVSELNIVVGLFDGVMTISSNFDSAKTKFPKKRKAYKKILKKYFIINFSSIIIAMNYIDDDPDKKTRYLIPIYNKASTASWASYHVGIRTFAILPLRGQC